MSENTSYTILIYGTVIFFIVFPLLFNLPFRIHLDLPYEGAYRIYSGQMPFRDFTMPLSYGFFVIPTICFYVFGPYLSSLIIAQSILNAVSCLSFISIFKSLKLSNVQIFVSLLVFCLSYIFIYFWPWYNNTAFTYEILAISLILKSIFNENKFKSGLFLTASVFFIFLTFFTKQDYGGISFLFGLVIMIYTAIVRKNYFLPFVYFGLYAIIAFILIYPLCQYDFFYWFNLGNPPHQNRLKLSSILNEIFLNSQWEKFYILAIAIVLLRSIKSFKQYFLDERKMLLLLICLGFILEALITKSTSFQSTGNTTFFHGFAIAIIIANGELSWLNKPYKLLIAILLIILWWSGLYWNYAQRILKFSTEESLPKTSTQQKPSLEWQLSEFQSFKKVKLPVQTIEGIKRLKQLPIIQKQDKKVLNITELTMLSHELNFKPLKHLPLWYHLNVGVFQHQVDTICNKISNKEYDLVLFEEIPSLDNFFPEQIRLHLKKHYKLTDSFIAPRKEGDSFIEVFTP